MLAGTSVCDAGGSDVCPLPVGVTPEPLTVAGSSVAVDSDAAAAEAEAEASDPDAVPDAVIPDAVSVAPVASDAPDVAPLVWTIGLPDASVNEAEAPLSVGWLPSEPDTVACASVPLVTPLPLATVSCPDAVG